MRTRGAFAPTTRAAALERYEDAGPAAKTVVRETAKAMEFGADEYDERVRPEVIETARDAIFAELLTVHVGTDDEFDDWLDTSDYDEEDVTRLGGDDVDNVAWHPIPFAETVIATTFQDGEDAAVSTLRRNAFGRVYREEFYESGR
ncbi:hypothetical protein J2751_001684 [Halorubrum alkaliphilum]|uniref:Uncharacterized protein n=1 Tax=Halorubrum alkaliphilum TaxID=261290 RepID=A0A8T4GGV7_9EURY|nr:DUF5809 family protein [Halorubrum alkaliphilum]MBP1922671.1 hypothetical protein [Halorubrum alkaliphilum]